MKKSIYLFMFAGAVILAGFLISHQVIYKQIILPKLADWHEIPFYLLLLMMLPILLGIFLVGMRITRILDFLLVTTASALITELSIFIMTFLSEPGFRQQPGSENIFINMRFVTIAFSYSIMFGIIWLGSSIIKKQRK